MAPLWAMKGCLEHAGSVEGVTLLNCFLGASTMPRQASFGLALSLRPPVNPRVYPSCPSGRLRPWPQQRGRDPRRCQVSAGARHGGRQRLAVLHRAHGPQARIDRRRPLCTLLVLSWTRVMPPPPLARGGEGPFRISGEPPVALSTQDPLLLSRLVAPASLRRTDE
jgi:hypothetical protein